MNRSDSTSTTAASGTFRKNTARQLTCSISQPPVTGPIAAVIALKPDHVPIARPRSRIVECRADDRQAARHQKGGAESLQRAADDQHPCGGGAGAQKIDAAVKKTTPPRNTRLRPNWSPIDPPTRISAPRNSAYASITHWTSVIVASRSAWSAGNATLTTVPSMKRHARPDDGCGENPSTAWQHALFSLPS